MSKLKLERVRALLPVIASCLFLLAAFLLWRGLEKVGYSELRRALESVEAVDIGCASVFAAGSYLALTGFDWLAVRTVSRSRLSYPKVALTSFTALSLGHTVGLAVLSSGTIRYRFYTHFGLGEKDVARIVVSTATTVALGLAGTAGAAGIFRSSAVADFAQAPIWLVVSLASLALLSIAGFLFWAWRADGKVRIRGTDHPLPSVKVALLQVAVGCLHFVLVAGTLHQLLGDSVDVSLFAFASFFAAGNTIAILSHVPGGLGVFEAVVLAVVPGADAAAALILFRLIYYAIPFVLGAVAFVTFEIWLRARSQPVGAGD
jgi:uncharacterized membrane protein YbhN (UPF0104 family)